MALSEIFLYTTSEYITLEHSPTDTCETVCNLVCRKLKIQPLVELLFGLRATGSRNFLAPCANLVARQKYEFRIRFKLPDVTKLKELDKELFKYYFCQVKHDLLENRIPHLRYEEHSRKIMGLVLTDMYLEMVQNKVSAQDLMGRYKKYVPKVIVKNHTLFFVKRAIKKELDMIEKFDHDPFYIIQSYISEIKNIAPEYLTEEYSATSPYLRERDQAAKTGWCPVNLQISPYHIEQSGLRVHYAYKNVWHNFTIENISGIETLGEEVKIITQHEREKFVLKFKDRDTVESFVSCLSGYYRLMVKWSINLCGNIPSPWLARLDAMRCHGPIGQEFAYKKIEANCNESGTFITRQCEENYDIYYIDIAYQKDDFRTYKLIYRDDKFFMQNSFGQETVFDDLLEAAKSIIVPSGKHLRLTQSEYDKSPKLLLCRCSSEKTELTLVSEVAEMRQGKTLLIDAQRELQLDESSERDCEGGVLSRMHGYLIVNEKSKVKVTLKILKPNMKDNLETFMHLAHKWSKLKSPDLMKMYGFTLYQPIAMVMESTGLGPLNEYLRRSPLSLNSLMNIVFSLLKAVVYLQDHSIVHNKIRCSTLFVVSDHDDDVYVRLGDPGFQSSFTCEDIPWIPYEYHDRLDISRYDLKSDIWACATTMWEIFSRGTSPISCLGCFRTPHPEPRPPHGCPEDMYRIIRRGWTDADSRFKPQSLFAELHIIQQKYARYYYPVGLPETISSNGSRSSVLSDETEQVYVHSNGDHSCASTSGSENSMNFEPATSSSTMRMVNGLHPTDWLGRPNYPTNVFSTDQYRVVRQGQIGCGNYGAVYRGEIQDNNDHTQMQQVAIKVLDMTQNSNGMIDFENECKIMKKLKHPNIVQIFDLSMDDANCVAIVMEYVENRSLDLYLRAKNLTNERPSKLLKFAKDIASGMEYLQLKKIVHRDLAARNVLVDKSERLKISDFGLARFVNIDGYYMCRDLEKKVPIAWYAPETLSQSIYTVHSDIWSYGVTLYEIFSGGMEPILLPGKELSTESLLNALNEGIRLPKPPQCPQQIYEKLMIPCWNQDKNKRPTFTLILDTIDRLMSEYGQEV
ncbi:Tyrosine-protein kinase hopscotch [Sergentomyia squamirostris]